MENKKYLPYLLLLTFACSSMFFFWPGFLSPDSMSQLNEAISGAYRDGSPPIMSLYWSFWLWWKQGPEPMLLTHQLLLFGSAFILLHSLKNKKIFWIVPFIPMIPHVLLYSGAIWKDIGFAYTFLLAAMLLSNANIKKQKLSILQAVAVWFLLFYGTGVKYQAIFLIPIMSFWFSLTLLKNKSLTKKIITWLVIWMSILASCYVLQKALVTPQREGHMWQNVKLFDLSGISIQKNEEFFPKFIKDDPKYSFEKVKEFYKPDKVDRLMVHAFNPGKNKEERDILWNMWFETVKKYPLEYLRHRYGIWKTMVKLSPMKSLDDLTDLASLPPKVKFILDIAGIGFVKFIKQATSFIYYVPLLLFYFFLGLWNWRKKPRYAVPLTMMTGTGLALMGALFIFSMASDLRYIYLTMVFFHFSHPIAWLTLFEKRDSEK